MVHQILTKGKADCMDDVISLLIELRSAFEPMLVGDIQSLRCHRAVNSIRSGCHYESACIRNRACNPLPLRFVRLTELLIHASSENDFACMTAVCTAAEIEPSFQEPMTGQSGSASSSSFPSTTFTTYIAHADTHSHDLPLQHRVRRCGPVPPGYSVLR